MESWILKRKYPEQLLDNEIKKANLFLNNLQNKKREKGALFEATYHPTLF